MRTIAQAIVLGIRDYVEKSGAPGVLIGLSGGIDSAVTAALAVQALGSERVMGVRMPSQYSSTHSLEDAQDLADALGIKLRTIDIEPGVQALRDMLRLQKPVSDQNLQSRVRGLTLMGLSNDTGYFVLSTGNKSELAMGYTTLYGDMCGALMPIGDLYKTQVYELARLFNEIPERSITKAPSAELAPGQLDLDTLPPYELLDVVLECYVERDMAVSDIAAWIATSPLAPRNDDLEALVGRIVKQVNASEYKRKQAPPILMVSKRVFGEARRWPIVCK
jgi:NAD+ synthase (glutamine-hydrolysing)